MVLPDDPTTSLQVVIPQDFTEYDYLWLDLAIKVENEVGLAEYREFLRRVGTLPCLG